MAERPPPKMGPGRRVVFRPDHSQGTGFGGFIRSDQVRDPTAAIAQEIAKAVGAASARSEGPGPHMADLWKVKKNAGLVKVAGNIRVRVDVFNPDIAAAAQEFGAGPRRGQRRGTLRRIASQWGDFKAHGQKEA